MVWACTRASCSSICSRSTPPRATSCCSGSSRSQPLFEGFANVQTQVLGGSSKLWWDQVAVPRAARRGGADLLFNPKFSLPLLSRIPAVFVLQSCDWYVNPGQLPLVGQPLHPPHVAALLPQGERPARHLPGDAHRADAADANQTVARNGHARRGRPELQPVARSAVAAEVPRAISRCPERYIFTVARVLHTGQPAAAALSGRQQRAPGARLSAVPA